jgi:hypothetical protein
MVPLKLKAALDRNISKQKHDKKMIYRPRGSRDYIGESLAIKGRHRMKLGQKQTPR